MYGVISPECLAFPRAVGINPVCFTCSVLLKYNQGDQAGDADDTEYVTRDYLLKLSFNDLLVMTVNLCSFSSFLIEATFLLLKSSASSSSFLTSSENHRSALDTQGLLCAAQGGFHSSLNTCLKAWRKGKRRACHCRWHRCVRCSRADSPSVVPVALKPSLCYPFNNATPGLSAWNVNSQVFRKQARWKKMMHKTRSLLCFPMPSLLSLLPGIQHWSSSVISCDRR